MIDILFLRHIERGKLEKEGEEELEEEKIREYRLLRKMIDIAANDPDPEKRLDDQEKMILIERIKGRTLKDIGLPLGLSRQRIDQVAKKAIRKLPPVPEGYINDEDLMDPLSIEIMEIVLGYFNLSEEECLTDTCRTKSARQCLAYLLAETAYWPHDQIAALLHSDVRWVQTVIADRSNIESHLASLQRCLTWSD